MAAAPRVPTVVSALLWCMIIVLLVCAFVSIVPVQVGPLFPVVAATPWLAMASFVVLLVVMVLRMWGRALLTAIAFGLLSFLWVPSMTGNVVAEGSAPVTVMSPNLRFGLADPAAVLQILRDEDPDLVSLQEVTPQLFSDLNDGGFKKRYPYVVDHAAAGPDGTVLASRWPITQQRRVKQTQSANLVATVDTPTGDITVAAIHPAAPKPLSRQAFDEDWTRVMPELLGLSGRTIVAGDFNATPNNEQLRELSFNGYTSAATDAGAGLAFTWPRQSPPGFPVARIDHVLFRGGDWRVAKFTLLNVSGSDHLAIVTTLVNP